MYGGIRAAQALFLLSACLLVAVAAFAQDEPRDTYVAAEDTFSFGSAEFDTLTVSAKRVSVDEVIRAIGEQMEADRYTVETHEFTVLTTVIYRESDEPDCDDYGIWESAVRQRTERGVSVQTVTLWERERKWRDGELKEEDEKKELQTDWQQIGDGVAMTVPFALETADQYEYELEDRHLVGNNIVYRIGFKPRNRFDALPSGTAWVDYSDLALRRFEVRFEQAVPVPLFIEAIPFLRFTAKKRGDYWFPDEIHARAELRNLPLPDWPANIEVRVQFRDEVINGVAYNDDGTIRETAAEGSAE